MAASMLSLLLVICVVLLVVEGMANYANNRRKHSKSGMPPVNSKWGMKYNKYDNPSGNSHHNNQKKNYTNYYRNRSSNYTSYANRSYGGNDGHYRNNYRNRTSWGGQNGYNQRDNMHTPYYGNNRRNNYNNGNSGYGDNYRRHNTSSWHSNRQYYMNTTNYYPRDSYMRHGSGYAMPTAVPVTAAPESYSSGRMNLNVNVNGGRGQMHDSVLPMVAMGMLKMMIMQNFKDCPKNWYGHSGHCYKFSRMRSGRGEALRYCKAYNSHLVSIQSPMENYLLKDIIAARDMEKRKFWTSGKTTSEGWKWTSCNSAVNYTYWEIPNDGDISEDEMMHWEHPTWWAKHQWEKKGRGGRHHGRSGRHGRGSFRMTESAARGHRGGTWNKMAKSWDKKKKDQTTHWPVYTTDKCIILAPNKNKQTVWKEVDCLGSKGYGFICEKPNKMMAFMRKLHKMKAMMRNMMDKDGIEEHHDGMGHGGGEHRGSPKDMMKRMMMMTMAMADHMGVDPQQFISNMNTGESGNGTDGAESEPTGSYEDADGEEDGDYDDDDDDDDLDDDENEDDY